MNSLPFEIIMGICALGCLVVYVLALRKGGVPTGTRTQELCGFLSWFLILLLFAWRLFGSPAELREGTAMEGLVRTLAFGSMSAVTWIQFHRYRLAARSRFSERPE